LFVGGWWQGEEECGDLSFWVLKEQERKLTASNLEGKKKNTKTHKTQFASISLSSSSLSSDHLVTSSSTVVVVVVVVRKFFLAAAQKKKICRIQNSDSIQLCSRNRSTMLYDLSERQYRGREEEDHNPRML